jgi:prepilin-type N-terminal cleavage/methylation domain-containing protein
MRRLTAGVTLVEVLIAIAVLGVGILALTGSSALVTG